MANCPNCGSERIQLTKDTTPNYGAALVGQVLFGQTGAIIGALSTDQTPINICLSCGTSWKPTHIHAHIVLIRQLTNLTVDLAYERDRIFLQDFMVEIVPPLSVMFDKQNELDKKLELMQKPTDDSDVLVAASSVGCFVSVPVGIIGLIFFKMTLETMFAVFVGVSLVALILFSIYLTLSQKQIKEDSAKALRKAQDDAADFKKQSELDLRYRLQDFINRH